MPRYFRDNGFENVAQVASTLLSGVVLSGQGTNTTTYILGVNAHANTTLKQNDNNGAGPTLHRREHLRCRHVCIFKANVAGLVTRILRRRADHPDPE
jgi:hypothetical protein